jgi:hypothetical protein
MDICPNVQEIDVLKCTVSKEKRESMIDISSLDMKPSDWDKWSDTTV